MVSDRRSAPRRTQTERRASSERRILDAAARVIAERGTSGATLREIADAASCSHNLPNYLFGTKIGLLQALTEHSTKGFLERLLGPEVQERGGLEALTRCLEVFVASLARPWPHTRAIYVLIAESFGAVPELRVPLNEHHDVMRGHFERWIAEGMARGEIRDDLRVDAQAMLLVAIMRGVGLQVLSDPGRFDVDSVVSEVGDSVRRALRPPS